MLVIRVVDYHQPVSWKKLEFFSFSGFPNLQRSLSVILPTICWNLGKKEGKGQKIK